MKYRSVVDDIADLQKENEKLKRTMRLHAGDCCSLNNEVELFRGYWEDAEERNKMLEEALKDHGRHGRECHADQGDMCTCGWSEKKAMLFGD